MLLPRLPRLVDHPESVRPLWEDEDARLSESLEAIERGVIQIEEQPTLDLAVVTVPTAGATAPRHASPSRTLEAVRPTTVNQSTSCLRVLVVHGGSYRLELRYETWVMFRSRPVLPRPDLRLLAARLDEREPGPARWTPTVRARSRLTCGPTGPSCLRRSCGPRSSRSSRPLRRRGTRTSSAAELRRRR